MAGPKHKRFEKLKELPFLYDRAVIRSYTFLHNKPLWTKQPLSIQLDTQNHCTLNCVYCNPQGSYIKKHGELPLSTIKHVLTYFQNHRLHVSYVRPYMNGDPLLESRLPEITREIKNILNCKVTVFTNGAEPQFKDRLITDSIDEIRVTVSAATPATYTRIHGKNRFKECLSTIQWLAENRKNHQRLFITFIVCPQNLHELDSWKTLFTRYEQDVRGLHLTSEQPQSNHVKGNSQLNTLSKHSTNTSLHTHKYSGSRPCPCFAVLPIGFEGQIMHCCMADYKHNYGHVEETDILEAWYRKLDIGLNHSACHGCNVKNPEWQQIFEEYVW